MTAVCLKAKNSIKTTAQSHMFTSFDTDSKSCLFIKQLTSTCISTILYLRKVLSDDYFEAKSFEGTTLKLLKSRKGDNYTSKIEQWLEGAFEAIEKKYLKRLMLDIQDAESDLTLEIYTMTFNYYKEKKELNLKESESLTSTTKLNAVKLLQMCYAITQTYSSLPSQVKLSIRLTYHENTPENYQPNGYMAWEERDRAFPKQPRSIEIGVTGTQYHFFKFINKSCLNDNFFKDMENQLENSNTTVLLGALNNTQPTDDVEEEKRTRVRRELYFNNSDENIKTVKPVSPKTNEDTSFQLNKKHLHTSSHSHKEKPELLESKTKKNSHVRNTEKVKILNKLPSKGDLKVRCACLCNERSKTMFPCLSCRFLVHGECFGILKFDGSKKIRFYCHICHQTENNFKCHDKVIISLKSSSDQQKLSLLRKVLRHCTLPYVEKITLKKMEKICGARCPKNIVEVILNKMVDMGVVIPQGRLKTHLIDKQVLANKLVHYFYKVQNSSQTQSQDSPYSLRTSENTRKKNDFDEFFLNKQIKPTTTDLREGIPDNNQISQQSFDIFKA